jgi:hypothetical protein
MKYLSDVGTRWPPPAANGNENQDRLDMDGNAYSQLAVPGG